MSQPDISKKPARPLNRWGAGILSALQIGFLALFLVTLNYLGEHHYFREDLSREGNYTLSPSTKRYLRSDAIAGREIPIKWIMVYRRSSPLYERTRAIAEEYERISKGKIVLEVVDPLRSSDRTQEIVAAYGLPLTKDLIIIDARTDDQAVSTATIGTMPTLDPNLDSKPSRILNPNIKVIVADDMTIFTTTERLRRITGFQGEDVLTARLVESIEGRARKMVFLADKSQAEIEGDDSPLKALQTTLQFQNIELKGINLAGLTDIPEEAEGVVMVAPRYDFTAEEIAVLTRYWNRPRAAILALLKAGEIPQNLRTFLRSLGVTPRNDRLIATLDDRVDTSVRGIFTYGVDFNEDLAGQSTIFEGASSSLQVREGAEDLMNQQINPVGLIQAAEGFWGETKFGEKSPKFDLTEDNRAPLFLAACVTRGAASDDRFASDTSRMVVMSNTDFLNPKYQRAENIDFLASSANWLMNRESLAGIGPRSIGTYKLPILDAQVSFINRVNLFFLPASLILIGAFVWISRRA